MQLELLHSADKQVERTHQCSMLRSEYHTRARLTFALCLYGSVEVWVKGVCKLAVQPLNDVFGLLCPVFLLDKASWISKLASFVSRISSWGLSGKEAGLCQCEERGASLTLTSCVNFQILSNIIYRLSAINICLTRAWYYQSWLLIQNSLLIVDSWWFSCHDSW